MVDKGAYACIFTERRLDLFELISFGIISVHNLIARTCSVRLFYAIWYEGNSYTQDNQWIVLLE